MVHRPLPFRPITLQVVNMKILWTKPSKTLSLPISIPCSHRAVPTPTVVAPLGVAVKKGSGKLRLIKDGRYVNDYLVHIPNLTQPWAFFARCWNRTSTFIFTIDLKAGCHHMDVCKDQWQYLGFSWKDRFYCFTQLPFGFATSCWAAGGSHA